ncbi:FMN-linked oxidoreductase [Sarocladium strictum]
MPKATTPTSAFPALDGTALFSSFQLGHIKLEHRVIQAPLTRMRADKESAGVHVPGPRVVQYYGDRANKGGLQLTEATDICHNASAYPGVPGVFTKSQLTGWRKVTDAVHAKGGFIYSQLWHTGRASSTGMRGGEKCVSASDLPMPGTYLDGGKCDDDPPRALTVEEIHGLTEEWAAAAKRAVDEAGFDGVEIHSANGYLLEQFLHDNVNTRTDRYGGSVEGRCRFTLEVISAVTKAIGADKVGIRLSPYNFFQGTRDSDPNAHWSYLCEQIASLPKDQRPAYVHMVEPRFDEELDEEAKLASLPSSAKKQKNSLNIFRDILRPAGVAFLAAGNFNRDNAPVKVKSGEADGIIFGRHFIANPDLPKRLREGLELNKYDRTTFYGADPPEKGYNDYPFYSV